MAAQMHWLVRDDPDALEQLQLERLVPLESEVTQRRPRSATMSATRRRAGASSTDEATGAREPVVAGRTGAAFDLPTRPAPAAKTWRPDRVSDVGIHPSPCHPSEGRTTTQNRKEPGRWMQRQ